MKIFYQKKLDKHETEHEYEIVDNRERHKNLKEQLEIQWKSLEGKQK